MIWAITAREKMESLLPQCGGLKIAFSSVGFIPNPHTHPLSFIGEVRFACPGAPGGRRFQFRANGMG